MLRMSREILSELVFCGERKKWMMMSYVELIMLQQQCSVASCGMYSDGRVPSWQTLPLPCDCLLLMSVGMLWAAAADAATASSVLWCSVLSRRLVCCCIIINLWLTNGSSLLGFYIQWVQQILPQAALIRHLLDGITHSLVTVFKRLTLL